MSWPPPHTTLILEGRILGTPSTAGSKSAGVVRHKNPKTGRMEPVLVSTKDGLTAKTFVRDSSGAGGDAWRTDVREKVMRLIEETVEEWTGILDCPVVLEVCFFRGRNRSDFGASNALRDGAPAYPAVRPDGTMQLRAFEDALQGLVYREDSRIVSCRWDKRYGEPERLEFRLWVLPEKVGDLRLAEANLEQGTLV